MDAPIAGMRSRDAGWLDFGKRRRGRSQPRSGRLASENAPAPGSRHLSLEAPGLVVIFMPGLYPRLFIGDFAKAVRKIKPETPVYVSRVDIFN